jgi:hypothetical protein
MIDSKFDPHCDIIPADHWGRQSVYNYPSYKGIYYAFDKYDNVWILYDDFYNGFVRRYNAETHRLDQCFEDVRNYLWWNGKVKSN